MRRPSLLTGLSVLCLAVIATAGTTNITPMNVRSLDFEVNRGQVTSQALFLAHGSHSTLFLTSDGMVVGISAKGSSASPLRMTFTGAHARKIEAQHELPGKVNYLIDRDPSKWQTNVPTFAKVRYEGLYPGIDAVFYGREGMLEYDLIVAPGVSPEKISLKFEGAASRRIAPNGDLVLQTQQGELRQERPTVYQTISGVRHKLAGRFVIRADNTVGFAVAGYDHKLPLVIDPTLAYSTYLGGSDDDQGTAIAVDGSNRAYVYGRTASTNFPLKNAFDSTPAGSCCGVFITKFWANGGGLIYSTYFGGFGQPGGIAVDRFGAVYISGTGFTDQTPGKVIGPIDPGTNEAYVAKLSPSGTTLVYSILFGGSVAADANAIAIDSGGHAYVTGETSSADFPTTPGAYRTSGSGGPYVVKVKPDGSGFDYATYFTDPGDTSHVGASGIAIDGNGEAYITGTTDHSVVTTAGSFQASKPAFVACAPGDKTCRNEYDAYVAKFNSTGSGLVYSSYLGGNIEDDAFAIAVDTNGNAYVTGVTFSTTFPATTGAFRRTNPSTSEGSAFVTKVNPSGSALGYSTYLGGSGGSSGRSIAVNSAGHAFVAGGARAGFPLKLAIDSTQVNGDAFVTKLWATGGGLHWSTYVGGSSTDIATAVRLDGSGNAYVTGVTGSTDFRTTSGAYRRHPQGGNDVFVVKIAN